MFSVQGNDSERLKQMDEQIATLHAYIEQIGQNVLADASEGKLVI